MTDIARPAALDRLADLGLTLRPFRDPSDYGHIAAAMCDANAYDGIPWLPTEENIRTEWAGSDGLTPSSDVVIVEAAGQVVASAVLERVIRDGAPIYESSGHVHPDWRGRGIGAALLDHSLDRAQWRAQAEEPEVAVAMWAHAEAQEVAHRSLLDARGFTPIRHYFLMRRAGLDDLPKAALPEAPLPEGLVLRPVTPDQHRAIWDAECDAFQDHWGARVLSEHDYQGTFGHSGLDTSLWAVAWDGDEVAGVVQTWIWTEENSRLGVLRGWLERISVRRPWRKRGLGRAITAAAIQRLHEAGMTEAMLGVDAENPMGALGLYESLGFELFSRSAAYQRPLRGPATPSRV